MNFIESEYKKAVEKKFGDYEEYLINTQKEIVEWEQELFEAGMLAVAKKVRE